MGGYDEYAISDDVEIVQVQCAFKFYPGKKIVSHKKKYVTCYPISIDFRSAETSETAESRPTCHRSVTENV